MKGSINNKIFKKHKLDCFYDEDDIDYDECLYDDEDDYTPIFDREQEPILWYYDEQNNLYN